MPRFGGLCLSSQLSCATEKARGSAHRDMLSSGQWMYGKWDLRATPGAVTGSVRHRLLWWQEGWKGVSLGMERLFLLGRARILVGDDVRPGR
jgi:hypothetical protein